MQRFGYKMENTESIPPSRVESIINLHVLRNQLDLDTLTLDSRMLTAEHYTQAFAMDAELYDYPRCKGSGNGMLFQMFFSQTLT